MTQTTTIRNGIDVEALLATIAAVEGDPAVGEFTFKASSRWEEGTYNVGRIGGFVHAGQEDTSRDRFSGSRATSRPFCSAGTEARTRWSCCCRPSASATP